MNLLFRYTVEYDFSALPKEGVEAAEKKAALKTIAKTFQERYSCEGIVTYSYLKQNENEKEKTKAGVAYLFKKLYF